MPVFALWLTDTLLMPVIASWLTDTLLMPVIASWLTYVRHTSMNVMFNIYLNFKMDARFYIHPLLDKCIPEDIWMKG